MRRKVSDAQKVKVIEEFCRHLEEGKCEYSFVEYDFSVIEEFAVKLDKKNPELELVEKIKKSLRKSFAYWENKLIEMYDKPDKKYFFPLWIFYMKSRFHFGASDYIKKKESNKIVKIDLCLDKDIKKIDEQE